jgi:hypothetical protein
MPVVRLVAKRWQGELYMGSERGQRVTTVIRFHCCIYWHAFETGYFAQHKNKAKHYTQAG